MWSDTPSLLQRKSLTGRSRKSLRVGKDLVGAKKFAKLIGKDPDPTHRFGTVVFNREARSQKPTLHEADGVPAQQVGLDVSADTLMNHYFSGQLDVNESNCSPTSEFETERRIDTHVKKCCSC